MISALRALRTRPLLGSVGRRFSEDTASRQSAAMSKWTRLKKAEVVVVLAGILGVYVYNKESLDTMVVKLGPLEFKFKWFLAKAKVERSSAGDKYVSRIEFEKKIKDIFTTDPGTYDIVYGAKGTGKSELVAHCAIKQEAVKLIRVKSADTFDDLIANVLKQLIGETETTGDFMELLDMFIVEKKITPTFIFDVDIGSDITAGTYKNTYKNLRSLAKSILACKCRCIIVLSEASAVLEFGGDPTRESYLFVDEMTRLEADELLVKLSPNRTFTNDEKKLIYDNIGTSPGVLKKLVVSLSKGMSIQNYVDLLLQVATRDLESFPLKPILTALNKHPEGVPIMNFKGMKYNGVSLYDTMDVGTVMRARGNPLIFRKDLEKFQLMSTAHKTALNSYADPWF